MKKLTTIFAALVMLISTSAFANVSDNSVSKEVKAAFLKNFAAASNVTWEVTDDLYYASFDLDNKTVNAAYNEKGELLGISRKLQLADLPLTVSQSLKSKFADYTISDKVSEIVVEGQTFYYASVEGATKRLLLKCYSDGQINVEKRTKK